jgi:hypothetical protein
VNNSGEFLRVKNFEKYQHYSKRRPPWIKLYFALLSDSDFSLMSSASKMHTIAIMLLASQYDNKIPFNKKWITQVIVAQERINWDEVLSSGFVICYQDASNALASCKQHASTDTEVQRRGEGDPFNSPEGKINIYKTKPQKRCPRLFVISDEMRLWAKDKFPRINVDSATEAFMDHEFKNSHTDWMATWRQWIRSPLNSNGKENHSDGNLFRPVTDGSNLLTDEEKEAYRKTGDWHVRK